MANTYKNIVITPNRDTDAANVPFIRFSGGDATSNTDINVRVYTTQSGTLSFEGSAGQLFSITNDLTNTIFSVNDVSGIPSLEIDAAGLIKLAEFGGNVAIGRSNASHKLDIVGTANASNLLVNGNMVFTHANDGAGSNFDADLLDGQHGAYYGIKSDVTAAFLRANNSLLSSSYTAADVLAKLITVDGAGTTLDADLLDGQQGSYYGIAADVTAAFLRANNSLLSSSYTAADVLSKLLTVDGAGTTLDADLLDGQQGAYYGISTDVAAANRVANAAFLHANSAFATANGRVSSVSGTGTVSGLTLSGTVTTTGSLTLGGTLSASVIDNMTDEHRLFNNMGDTHGTRTAFDITGPSINFGWRFVQGATNGPGVTGTQFYSEYVGLGNEYPATGAGSYGMQIAYPRNVTEPYITIRYNEANTFTSWQKVSAGNSDKLNSQAASYYGIASDVTAAFLRANNSLLSSSYTAADVLAKLITVDGAGTTLDADLLDGQQGAYYGIASDVTAAFLRANNSLLSSSYTAADVLAKVLTVDGAGSGLDADLLDGISSASFMRTDAASTHTTGKYTVYTPAGTLGTVSGTNNLEIFQPTAGTDAFLTFHVSGDYAANFGIDGTTNDLFYGGWSAGANKFKVWHSGNDGAASGLDADLLDGQHGSYYGIATDVTAAFLRANNSLLSSSYTAADVLAKIITVDGAGTTLDADLLDGQHGTYYGIASDVTAAFLRANNSLLSSSYTAADVLAKIITVDGAGTSLDADLLDGQQGTYYGIAADVTAAFLRANNSLLSSSYTAADVLAKLITVDGAGTNLDADLLDGQQGTYYGIAADVTAAFLRANNSLLSSSYTAADVLAKLLTVDGAGTNLDADLLDGQQGTFYGRASDVTAAFARANAASPPVITTDALNATRYITFEDSTTGNMANANVSTSLTYNPGTNRLAVGGTGTPSNTLHVFGTANVSGTLKSAGLYDSTNRLLLIKNSAGTVVWGN